MTDRPARPVGHPDEWCPCSLIARRHRRSLHENVDLGAVLRAYLRHIPVEVHAQAVEMMYDARRRKEARAIQKTWEEINR